MHYRFSPIRSWGIKVSVPLEVGELKIHSIRGSFHHRFSPIRSWGITVSVPIEVGDIRGSFH
jgi:hypothetical protein